MQVNHGVFTLSCFSTGGCGTMVCGGWCGSWDGEQHNLQEREASPRGASSCKTSQNTPLSSWDQDVPAPELPYLVAALLVGLCAGVCFVNSLFGDFVFDDSEAIVNNNDIRGETPLCNLFHNDFWGTRLTHPSSHKSYRPLTVLSFRINYSWGALDPFSYHAVNIVLHCLVSIMSLRVFYVVFGSQAPRAAVLAAILFATHPIHTEAVSGIVGRADLLCALFVFVAFLSYVRAVKQASEEAANRKQSCCWAKRCGQSNVYLVLTAAATAIAMLCKEVGITALGVCSAYDIILAHGGVIGRTVILLVLGHSTRAVSSWRSIPDGVVRRMVWRHVVLMVTGVGLLVARWIVMGSTVPRFMKVDNPASFLDSVVFRICVDGIGHGHRTISACHKPVLPGGICHSRACAVSASGRHMHPGGDWHERAVSGRPPWQVRQACLLQRVIQAGYLVLVVVFILRCQQRSREWLTEKQLFNSGLDVCPLNAKVHYNIGKVAADAGDVMEAVRRYREALRLNPDYDQAMNNLANILKDQGHLDEALHLLQQATTLRPDFAAAWMNLGIVQASLGDHGSAENSYLTALSHRSVYPDCLYNLGNLYLEKGDHQAALATWTNATTLKPSLAVAWTNMLILLDSQGLYQPAIDIADQALKHLPNEPALHFNLANTLGKLNRYQESESHFLLATTLDPSNANYWANLGVLYHRWRKYEQAQQSYVHALRLNPTLRSAQDNLSMLLKATGKITR
ncbi:protein O-mannosyl-transferase TMTC4-like isoform X4 [Portunus trituberculatus]|uniref:protein O-mannosyl-transferase TMTC4-like isoform X4 n=1 Tax=Portunus trituberculatus TaxID=210409 RepID=UPI001E1CCB49|nr:protein O-mannosyl-transferase TMTC4-like isoform X4 [Portunus trituberculatus]